MSIADFLEAVVPFNNEVLDRDTEEYMKDHKCEILRKYIDADNSDSITFCEFIFFLTIVQTPIAAFKKYFKKTEPHNSVTKEEFAEMI